MFALSRHARIDTDANCVQVEDTEELWKRDNGRQGWGGAGGSQGDSAGQVCAGVLVKLVMDMYLKATPAVAFPLTLVMLHRSAVTL